MSGAQTSAPRAQRAAFLGLTRTVTAAWGACAFAAAIASSPGQFSDSALPFEGEMSIVVPSAQVAGRKVSIARFRSSLDSEAAISAARRQWQRQPGIPVIDGSSGHWRTVSRHDAAHITTIQIQSLPTGGSSGFISVWSRDRGVDPADAADSPDGRAWLPQGSSIANRTSSIDHGRRAVTLVAVHPGPMVQAWAELLDRLSEDGFAPLDGLSLPSRVRDARSGVFRKADTELVVTMDGRGPRLGIVIHVMERKP